VELYPKHEKAPYGLFRAGESYFMDIPSTIARDLRSADSSINTFTNYLKRYPSGEFVEKAKDMKTKAYNKLGRKGTRHRQVLHEPPRNKTLPAPDFKKSLDRYSESSIAAEAKELLKSL